MIWTNKTRDYVIKVSVLCTAQAARFLTGMYCNLLLPVHVLLLSIVRLLGYYYKMKNSKCGSHPFSFLQKHLFTNPYIIIQKAHFWKTTCVQAQNNFLELWKSYYQIYLKRHFRSSFSIRSYSFSCEATL